MRGMEREAFETNPGGQQEKRVRGLAARGAGSRWADWALGADPGTLRWERPADESGRQAPQGRTPAAIRS